MGSDKDDGRGIKPYLRKIGLTLEQHLERKAHPRSPFSINPRKLRHLLAVTRDASGMAGLIYTESSFFKSERITKPNPGSTSKWRSDRIMVEIPLYVSDELVKMTDFTADYSSLPKDLTDILEEGILRTSGVRQTNYSVLMSTTEDNDGMPPEGRTGILLHRGEPVIVNIDGKDFVVEAKGVGCPDGNNQRAELMHRTDYFGTSGEEVGGFDIREGMREYSNLEIQRRRKIPEFGSGDAVRALALFSFLKTKKDPKGDKQELMQAYLLRLAPTNIRASYDHNPDFPTVEDKEMVLSTSIGQHYAGLAKLEEILLHTTIHPENMVWTGTRYVLTDFADCRRLAEIKEPHKFLKHVLRAIKQVPEITENGINNFYATVAQELGVDWNPKTGYDRFINAIWSDYFAQKVYDAWKGNLNRSSKEIESIKSSVKNSCLGLLTTGFIQTAKDFLEREIDVLWYVPEAAESLEVARKRVVYLTSQLVNPADINVKFKQDPESFYGLFVLPYMQKGEAQNGK